MNKLTKTLLIGIIVLIPLVILVTLTGRYIHPYSYVSTEETSIVLKPITCSMCVSNIEKTLIKTEGVIMAEVSLKSKKANVRFNDRITTIEKIEEAISAAGYDANNKAADPEAFVMLSECCKKSGNPEHTNDPNSKGVQNDQKSCAGGCCNN